MRVMVHGVAPLIPAGPQLLTAARGGGSMPVLSLALTRHGASSQATADILAAAANLATNVEAITMEALPPQARVCCWCQSRCIASDAALLNPSFGPSIRQALSAAQSGRPTAVTRTSFGPAAVANDPIDGPLLAKRAAAAMLAFKGDAAIQHAGASLAMMLFEASRRSRSAACAACVLGGGDGLLAACYGASSAAVGACTRGSLLRANHDAAVAGLGAMTVAWGCAVAKDADEAATPSSEEAVALVSDAAVLLRSRLPPLAAAAVRVRTPGSRVALAGMSTLVMVLGRLSQSADDMAAILDACGGRDALLADVKAVTGGGREAREVRDECVALLEGRPAPAREPPAQVPGAEACAVS